MMKVIVPNKLIKEKHVIEDYKSAISFYHNFKILTPIELNFYDNYFKKHTGKDIKECMVRFVYWILEDELVNFFKEHEIEYQAIDGIFHDDYVKYNHSRERINKEFSLKIEELRKELFLKKSNGPSITKKYDEYQQEKENKITELDNDITKFEVEMDEDVAFYFKLKFC